MLYVSAGREKLPFLSVQSIIWDWCTISQRNHVSGACNCNIADCNYMHRSFLTYAQAVLTKVLDRNVFSEITCPPKSEDLKCFDRRNRQ